MTKLNLPGCYTLDWIATNPILTCYYHLGVLNLSLIIFAVLNPVAMPSTARASTFHPHPDRVDLPPPASIIIAALMESSSFNTSRPTERAQTMGSSVDEYSL